MNEDKASPLGEWLRQRREELDISLEQAEEETRIRARYLEALEAEEFDKLPGPVVGRGFLRNYAVYLELDPQETADRYSALIAPPEPESLSVVDEQTPFATGPFRPVALHQMTSIRSNRGWLIALVAVILIVALAVLIWQGYPFLSSWFSGQAAGLNRPTATQAPTKAALATATKTTVPTATTDPPTATMTEAAAITPTLGTPTLEPTPTLTFTPSPSPSPSAVVYTGIFMELVFTDTAWIQVTTDGVRQFQGELETDTYRSWYGEKRVELRVGNAGAVIVTVNGQLIGTLGAPGEVVDRVFEKVDDEVTEATTTPVPTGEATEEPTSTPTLEPTVTPASSALELATPVTTTLPITPTGTITATATITPTVTITPTTNP